MPAHAKKPECHNGHELATNTPHHLRTSSTQSQAESNLTRTTHTHTHSHPHHIASLRAHRHTTEAKTREGSQRAHRSSSQPLRSPAHIARWVASSLVSAHEYQTEKEPAAPQHVVVIVVVGQVGQGVWVVPPDRRRRVNGRPRQGRRDARHRGKREG
jgi:hypothetical protein